MKKLFTLLLVIAVSTTVTTAQNKDTKKADQLYARYQYKSLLREEWDPVWVQEPRQLADALQRFWNQP